MSYWSVEHWSWFIYLGTKLSVHGPWSLSVNSGGRRCPGVLLGTLETMGLTGAEGDKPSLSLVYISSCFAGDNGENDSLTRDLPNNDSKSSAAQFCADNTSGSLRLWPMLEQCQTSWRQPRGPGHFWLHISNTLNSNMKNINQLILYFLNISKATAAASC